VTWIGWYRRGLLSPWERIVEAENLEQCHRQLLQAAPAGTPSLDRCITGGAVPVDFPALRPAKKRGATS
jgi:hypothetical protein